MGPLATTEAAVEHYVGLDVSLKLTAICIVDRTGKIVREGAVASNPEAIAAFMKSHAPHVARIGLEAGATSTWLWTELNKMGLPVICIDDRHAKAALLLPLYRSTSMPRSSSHKNPRLLLRLIAMSDAGFQSEIVRCVHSDCIGRRV